MRLFKCKGDLRFDILAAHNKAGAATTATPPPEQALKEIAEPASPSTAAKQIAKVAKSSMRAFPARRRPKLFARFPVLPQLVVALAFVSVGQNFVSLVDLLKFVFGGFIARIDIRMILARQLAVGGLDLILGGGFGNAEDFIVVSKLDRHG